MAAKSAEIIDYPKNCAAQDVERSILNLYEAHRSAWACASASEDDDSLWQLVTDIENQIARFPATTGRSLAVKVVLAHDYMSHVPLRISLDADIKRLIGAELN